MELGAVDESELDVVDIDGGCTELMTEPPFPTVASTSSCSSSAPATFQAAPVLSLVSLNQQAVATRDFTIDDLNELTQILDSHRASRISVGRSRSLNTVCLDDARVSLQHFSIEVKRCGNGILADIPARAAVTPICQANSSGDISEVDGRPELDLVIFDESSNGTWVNEKKVGKGNSMALSVGDRIFVLPSAQVGQDEALGFAIIWYSTNAVPPIVRLQENNDQKRQKRRLPPSPARSVTCPPQSAAPAEDVAGSELAVGFRCGVCNESPIYRCVTSVPCGHNFCLACLLVWRRRSSKCPSSGCSQPIIQIVRNYVLDSAAETLLRVHPCIARSEASVRAMDAIEHDPANAAILRRMLRGASIHGVEASRPSSNSSWARSSGQRAVTAQGRNQSDRRDAVEQASSVCTIS